MPFALPMQILVAQHHPTFLPGGKCQIIPRRELCVNAVVNWAETRLDHIERSNINNITMHYGIGASENNSVVKRLPTQQCDNVAWGSCLLRAADFLKSTPFWNIPMRQSIQIEHSPKRNEELNIQVKYLVEGWHHTILLYCWLVKSNDSWYMAKRQKMIASQEN